MTDDRVRTWESFFRAASTTEERAHVWALAKSSGEESLAAAGFMRTLYLAGTSS